MLKKSPQMLNQHIEVDKHAVKKHVAIRLRMPYDLLENLDKYVASTVGLSRTGSILQAIDQMIKTKEKQE